MTESTETAVYVVDDDAAVRDALQVQLRAAGFRTEGFASASDFLERRLSAAGSGCALVDVRMPGVGGLELLERLRQRNVRIPVIVMTGHGDIDMAVQAMKLGAADFIEKPFRSQTLLERLRQAIAAYREVWAEEEERARLQGYLARLTPREREVMDRLVAGKLNKVVAAELDISVRTVEAHRAHIMEKLEVKSMSEVVRIALRTQAAAERADYVCE